MKKQFSDPDEDIMFEENITKISSWGLSQKRVFCVTIDHVYVFSNAKLSRKHRITNLGAIIQSNLSSELVLHFPKAKDLRITGLSKSRQQELMNLIQLRYINKKPEKTLEIYGVDNKSLKEYARDNAKYGFSNLPPIECRLRDKEIKGTDDDYEAQKTKIEKQQQQAKDEESLDLDFEENRFSMKGSMLEESSVMSTTSTELSMTQAVSDFRGSISVKRRATAEAVRLEDFDIISQLGRGTFGRVYLGELNVGGKKRLYAIKAIRKDVLLEYEQVQSTMLEKDIMFEADHPFLVGMDYLFQSETRLYFVMPFVRGGELYKVF